MLVGRVVRCYLCGMDGQRLQATSERLWEYLRLYPESDRERIRQQIEGQR